MIVPCVVEMNPRAALYYATCDIMCCTWELFDKIMATDGVNRCDPNVYVAVTVRCATT